MAVSNKSKKKTKTTYASTTISNIPASTARQEQAEALRSQYNPEAMRAEYQAGQQQRRQDYQSSGYRPGQSTQDIMSQAGYGTRPQGYNSKYGAQLDSIMQQIQGNPDFKYEFNGDNLFNQYKDMYTELGRQASMDAMGQAAGLTGGYGSSYGQQVGNQAFQQNLLGLYDKGMELRDRAYEDYRNKLADKYNLYGLVQSADETDYGRYRDTMADWESDRAFEEGIRQFEAQRADADYQFGASLAQSDYQFDRSMAQSDYQFEQTTNLDWAKLEEQQREHDNTLTEEQRQYEKSMAYKYVQQILAMGQIPSNELLVAAGLTKKDAKLMIEQSPAGGGGGGTGPSNPSTGNNDVTPMSYGDASLQVFRSTPLSTRLSSLTGRTGDDRTLSDLAAQAAKRLAEKKQKSLQRQERQTQPYGATTSQVLEAYKKRKPNG